MRLGSPRSRVSSMRTLSSSITLRLSPVAPADAAAAGAAPGAAEAAGAGGRAIVVGSARTASAAPRHSPRSPGGKQRCERQTGSSPLRQASLDSTQPSPWRWLPAAPATGAPRSRDNRSRSEKLMLLVDGSSYLYRAYHALPDLRGPEGVPTGALHGMVAMMKWLRERHPRPMRCACSTRRPDLPRRLVPRLQAHRAPMPVPLRQQIEPIHEVVRLAGLAGAGRAGDRGRRRHRTLACAGGRGWPPGADLDRRQGSGAAGHAAGEPDQHHGASARGARRGWGEGQIRRAARAHRRLPESDRRRRRQRARRRQGRPRRPRSSG